MKGRKNKDDIRILKLVLKRLYDKNIINLNEIVDIFNFKIDIEDYNLDIKNFIIKVLMEEENILKFIGIYYLLDITTALTILRKNIKYINNDNIEKYYLLLEKLKNYQVDDENDENEISDEYLFLKNFSIFSDILNYWQITAVSTLESGGWKTTFILNLLTDILINNDDVKIFYFWTTEVTKKEFYFKFSNIFFKEDIRSKFVKYKRIKTELRKFLNIAILKKRKIESVKEFWELLEKSKIEIEEKISVIQKKLEKMKKIKIENVDNIKRIIKNFKIRIESLLFLKRSIEDIENHIKEISEYDENALLELINDLIEELKIQIKEKRKDFLKKYEELEKYLKQKLEDIKNIIDDYIVYKAKTEIYLEEIIKTVENEWSKNIVIIIDYLQKLNTYKNFKNDIDKWQYISSNLLNLSKLSNKNVFILVASQVTTWRKSKLITVEDIKWFKSTIENFSWYLWIINLELFLDYNLREDKNPINYLYTIKNRNWWFKKWWYFFDKKNFTLNYIDDENYIRILNEQNKIWKNKVDIRIPYMEDLIEIQKSWFEIEDDKSKDENNKDSKNNKSLIPIEKNVKNDDIDDFIEKNLPF